MLLSTGACPFCHNGGNSPCFATYDNGYKCFTCGMSKFQDASYTAFIPRSTKKDVGWYIPEHTSNPNEFGVGALQFLYRYYVFNDMIKKHRIAFVPSNNSLLFPVFDPEGGMIFCQMRNLDLKGFITKGGKECLFLRRLESRLEPRLVIVEDYLSAVRLTQHCDVLLLAGTSMTYKTAVQCALNYSDFIIWLDGDDAGKAGAEKVSKALVDACNRRSLYSAYAAHETITIDIRNLDLDPKCYTDAEINRILGGF